MTASFDVRYSLADLLDRSPSKRSGSLVSMVRLDGSRALSAPFMAATRPAEVSNQQVSVAKSDQFGVYVGYGDGR